MALHASETAVSKSLHTLEAIIIIHKIRKGWSESQECSQWAVFTLIWRHKLKTKLRIDSRENHDASIYFPALASTEHKLI